VVPFLWVLPLALYLVTFILSFAGYYWRIVWRPGLTLGLGIMALLAKKGVEASLFSQIAGAAFALFAGCMVCHGELARLSPKARHLTSYYLTMAAGGAAGGALVALVAPVVLPDFWELPIFLLLPFVLMLGILHHETGGKLRARTWWFAWSVIAAVFWLGFSVFILPDLKGDGTTVARARNFYGVLRVLDDPPDDDNPMRSLRHGHIIHGTEFLDSLRRDLPTSYYAYGSGVELAIRQHPRRRAGLALTVGAVGLGAGTIASWGAPGDTLRFYEINPDVVAFSRRYFTFLRDSPFTIDVVMDDARLSLEREVTSGASVKRYDVIVVDAFSGDAIPVHLLTRECGDIYWRALKDDGILAIHISNRFLDLAPVAMGLAQAFDKKALRVETDDGVAALGSTWVLLSSNRAFFDSLHAPSMTTVEDPDEPPVTWTDHFSNLFGVLKK